MKKAVAAFCLAASAALAARGEPVKVILDTDMYTDYDDVGALAVLHALADAGECEILGVFSCTRANGSVAAVEICNAYYGRPGIPVGCSKSATAVSGGGEEHEKLVALQAKYPGRFRFADSDDAPDAIPEYRRILAAQPDASVVVCSIGFFTNLRDLLASAPDAHSPLAGRDLVAAKVKRWVAMGLFYPDGHEFNSDGDAAATRIALRDWPTPIVVSDFQYGRHLYAGRAVAERGGAGNPVADVFRAGLLPHGKVTPRTWDQAEGHPSWDESAILAAVRGVEPLFAAERGFYEVTRDDGYCVWRHDPASPHCRLLVKAPREEVGRIIDELMLRPPKLGAWGAMGDAE